MERNVSSREKKIEPEPRRLPFVIHFQFRGLNCNSSICQIFFGGKQFDHAILNSRNPKRFLLFVSQTKTGKEKINTNFPKYQF